ncbi:MerR family regulatory protein [Variibacter gotjawalensis]|uniref:MerR family regulatory protein n=1 Tax=Variibacter gotjawalensis TaxID=1333996 RepID=A0A0S3PXU3_9BRAD|nr:MerR family transcriptional regulator [Variibacter gotjawalensis]NIK46597.1 DNA-binding transcriptional MerR regulator [Variibacter gotjawalensis]RZS48500.1 MerR-like DNA binding protein [Variibacter gotjawalensis]BAT60762.1 MerR family regulatory protein [Variibacter gotjawalensis]
MDKAPDAFRTISEVADELDVPQHVLRFWETRFGQIRPMKRGGGRRYYRPDDVDLLRGIRHLLYGEGYTIRGVQRLLKDNGAKFVQGVWMTEGTETAQTASPPAVPADEVEDAEDEVEDETEEDAEDEAEDTDATDDEDSDDDEGDEEEAENRKEPTFAKPAPRVLPRTNPVAIAPAAAPPTASAQPARPQIIQQVVSLSAEDRRKLEAALFELGECRRLLDLALKE